jgi:hypothetical protein
MMEAARHTSVLLQATLGNSHQIARVDTTGTSMGATLTIWFAEPVLTIAIPIFLFLIACAS